MKQKYHQYVMQTSDVIDGVRSDLDKLDETGERVLQAGDVKRADQLKDVLVALVTNLELVRRQMAQIRDRHT